MSEAWKNLGKDELAELNEKVSIIGRLRMQVAAFERLLHLH